MRSRAIWEFYEARFPTRRSSYHNCARVPLFDSTARSVDRLLNRRPTRLASRQLLLLAFLTVRKLGVVMSNWATIAPAITSAFLASLVEVVEAFTIVLAVASVRGARPAVGGALAGLAVLALIVLVFGPAVDHIPLWLLQISVGVLLLLFGMRWLRKAV